MGGEARFRNKYLPFTKIQQVLVGLLNVDQMGAPQSSFVFNVKIFYKINNNKNTDTNDI